MRKRIVFVSVLSCILVSGCSNNQMSDKNEVEEIVLYISEHSENWIESEKNYEATSSERIDAFNDRLSELNVNLKLIVKTYPDCERNESCNLTVKDILKNDKTADIVKFNEVYVSDLEPLTTYFQTKEGTEVLDLLSEDRIRTLKIKNELYHMPKMNYPLLSPLVYINASYYEKHKAELEGVKQDGIALLTYFRDHYEENPDWLLFDHMDISPFFEKEYQPISNTPFFIRKKDGKVVNPYEEQPILDVMRVVAEIRWKGYTGKFLEIEKLKEIRDNRNFILSSSTGLSERVVASLDSDVKLDMGPEYYSYESGFSILKESDQKEKAFQLLAIMNTDEKSSSILQFGTQPERNSEGKIIDHAHTMGGSFIGFGNNLIIESAENEVEKKLETFQNLEKTSDVKNHPLFPSVFDLTNIAQDLKSFENIMRDSPLKDTSILGCLACTIQEDVQDPDTFMKEIETVNQKLKAAGIDAVIMQLQEQVDGWE